MFTPMRERAVVRATSVNYWRRGARPTIVSARRRVAARHCLLIALCFIAPLIAVRHTDATGT